MSLYCIDLHLVHLLFQLKNYFLPMSSIPMRRPRVLHTGQYLHVYRRTTPTWGTPVLHGIRNVQQRTSRERPSILWTCQKRLGENCMIRKKSGCLFFWQWGERYEGCAHLIVLKCHKDWLHVSVWDDSLWTGFLICSAQTNPQQLHSKMLLDTESGFCV